MVVLLLGGVLAGVSALTITGLALLLWFGWEWLFFAVRVRTLRQRLLIHREVWDDRGPVNTLWAGRILHRACGVACTCAKARLPYLAVADPVPFTVVHEKGDTTTDGELRPGAPLELSYTVFCPLTGVVRFEGLRIELCDLQGFFCHVTFLRDPLIVLLASSRERPGPQERRADRVKQAPTSCRRPAFIGCDNRDQVVNCSICAITARAIRPARSPGRCRPGATVPG